MKHTIPSQQSPHFLYPNLANTKAYRLTVVAVLVCAALFTFFIAPDFCSAATETVHVNVLVARVRNAPTTTAPILFRIRRGDSVTLIRAQNDWYSIKTPDGLTGWAHQSLFTKAQTEHQTTTASKAVIQSIHHQAVNDGQAEVSFQISGFHPPETFVLSGDKPRVVCDFMDMRVSTGLGPRLQTGESVVKDIRISPYGGTVPRVRIVLDLIAGPSYTVDQTFFKKENLYVVSVQSKAP